MSKQVTWTQSGNLIEVEVTENVFLLTINGTFDGRYASILKPMPKDRAMYAQRGAYGNIGRVVIYTDRAQELLGIQDELIAANPLNELRRLERALYAAMDATSTWQDRNDNPAQVYANEQQAKAALDAWIEAHRDLYDAEMARREAAAQARLDAVDLWR